MKQLAKEIETSKLKSNLKSKILKDSNSAFVRQTTIDECQKGILRTATKEEIDGGLANWVVEGTHCFSEVEKPSFQLLWNLITTIN